MNIEQELDDRIQRLRKRRWVNHCPTYNQSCMLYDDGCLTYNEKVTTKTQRFLSSVLVEMGYSPALVSFNDSQTTVEPVINLLEKARAKAGELGL
jgi:hypothetical protein